METIFHNLHGAKFFGKIAKKFHREKKNLFKPNKDTEAQPSTFDMKPKHRGSNPINQNGLFL